MKVLELLNRKGLELTKGKVLDLSTFKFGGSEVHVICIAESQKLIDKFNTDVISSGVPLEFSPEATVPTTIRVKLTLKPCRGPFFEFYNGIEYPKTISFFYDPNKTTMPQELVIGKIVYWECLFDKSPDNVSSIRITMECDVLNKDDFLRNLYYAITFLSEANGGKEAAYVSKSELDSPDVKFSQTTKESCEGNQANALKQDEVGTMPSIYVKADYEVMNRDNCLASIRMLHEYIDKLQKEKCDMETTYFTHLPADIKAKFLDELLSRSNDMEILNSYSIWLTKNGYMDSDWKDEEPFAIDSFLKDKK